MKNTNSLTIGIVLAEVPGYSETFFNSKVGGLREKGHTVILFTSGSKKNYLKGVKVVRSYKIHRFKALQLLKTSLVLFRLLVLHPFVTLRFVKEHRSSGSKFKNVFIAVYNSAHILPYKLDWLHFGFGTIALGKEVVAKAIRARMAVSFRGFDIAIYPLKQPYCYKFLWQNVDRLHVISDDLINLAKKHGMPEGANFTKITPAIHFDSFYQNRQERMNETSYKLLTVGRLHWKKGYEYLLAALSLLKQKGVVFECTIVGKGSDEDRLKFAAYQYDLLDVVVFAGNKTHLEVADYMKEAHIYLQPSVQEGFCNAVLEAQAAGLLCIVSNAEGLPENVLDGKTGWVVGKRDTKALAEAIETVMKLPDTKKLEIITTAQNRVRSDYDTKEQVNKFIDFYERT